ncbi:MAG TPA: type II toxin-antitoxin system RelB/DinJ family antitoxin [Ignavibacteria bacterium]|nr:type II toxin-antitoxin system RelB/DinJ family antitoxin [Ignavibacteria bacterium]HAX50222.1 type II toxin-antitoxin system antitoxin, RelB/DinJ family [Bacteroidota bacterium]HRE12059.1 type II toxin-antitoxin system RelB/DinJ family antitoxin [Ignavibacteria bacterium]HRF65241.1 type II toxin-antitoxin system RelB/DinJ family antitoxin [Ignavibacteria bacterium]HRJ05229.1 type II toxin-antitoxin system RelB/DinJ family antitoxin [Ignavibacteria bacterium]
MSKTAMIRARTEPRLKKEVESIFSELGITSTEAINMFYKQVRLRKGIPFEVKIPNKETLKAFKDSDARKNLKTFKNINDLLKDLKS